MTSQFEFWLTDDAGIRLLILDEISFMTYTRSVHSVGTCNFGLPFKLLVQKISPWFKPDWRLEAWRSPNYGIPMRLEDVFFLRKPNLYTRADGMQIIQFYGRSGNDLLNRRTVIQRSGTSWASKSNLADDMMKEIVREQMLFGSVLDEDGVVDNTRAWPKNEFLVEADSGLGPSVTKQFSGKRVLDVMKEIQDSTYQQNADDNTVKRIHFGVKPFSVYSLDTTTAAPLGWIFFTKADLYGNDRTKTLEFSLENENIASPRYAISHLDEFNYVYINGNGTGETQVVVSVEDTARVLSSRWNRIETVISAKSETTTVGLQNSGYTELEKGKPQLELPLTFLNVPASKNTPQSLYGVDWDLGDRVRVKYAGLYFEVELNVIYVSVDESGKETITGRNEVLA